jgi:hypothetical protein
MKQIKGKTELINSFLKKKNKVNADSNKKENSLYYKNRYISFRINKYKYI